MNLASYYFVTYSCKYTIHVLWWVEAHFSYLDNVRNIDGFDHSGLCFFVEIFDNSGGALKIYFWVMFL